MFSLIFWIDSKKISVIKSDELIVNVEENKQTLVEYEDEVYDVKVLKKSGKSLTNVIIVYF